MIDMNRHMIVGVHVTDRFTRVPEVQHLFTVYGCNIKTRLGLHEVENVCSPNGLIILEMYGDETRCNELVEKLALIEGLEAKTMIFEH